MQVTTFETGPLHDLGQDRLLGPDEIRAEVAARAAGLAAAGIRPLSLVLLTHGNRWQFLCDLLALWQLGACAVPVDPSISPPELSNLLAHSEASHVIYHVGTPVSALQDQVQDQVQASWLDCDTLAHHEAAPPPSGLSLDAPALILYTSGSTGEPKGVVHSLRSLTARLDLLTAHVPLERMAHSLNLLPTHFGHGLICNCLFPWLNGQKLYLLPSFSLATISLLGELLDRHQISFMSSVPSLWRLALRVSRPPKAGSLTLVHCGSAPLSADLRAKIQEWTGTQAVRNTYGITETGSWLAGQVDDAGSFSDGYIGPVWGGELLVVDEDGSPLPAGSPGLVIVRTPALMTGYHKRPDLTSAAVVQGWFLTGDIGHLDDRGHLTLVGRQRHEINKGGLKVWPEDVDLALERHPDVAEACSFAIEDPVAGQNIAAAIVPRAGLADGFDLDALRTWLAGQLSPHKHPIRWFLVDSIPRTSRGKVNREAVAQSLLSAPEPPPVIETGSVTNPAPVATASGPETAAEPVTASPDQPEAQVIQAGHQPVESTAEVGVSEAAASESAASEAAPSPVTPPEALPAGAPSVETPPVVSPPAEAPPAETLPAEALPAESSETLKSAAPAGLVESNEPDQSAASDQTDKTAETEQAPPSEAHESILPATVAPEPDVPAGEDPEPTWPAS